MFLFCHQPNRSRTIKRAPGASVHLRSHTRANLSPPIEAILLHTWHRRSYRRAEADGKETRDKKAERRLPARRRKKSSKSLSFVPSLMIFVTITRGQVSFSSRLKGSILKACDAVPHDRDQPGWKRPDQDQAALQPDLLTGSSWQHRSNLLRRADALSKPLLGHGVFQSCFPRLRAAWWT